MDTSTSISIVSWKITKKPSPIISDISIPGCLPHSGFSHRFKMNADSPSMSDKDIQLLYCLIKRLLFIIKITRLFDSGRNCILHLSFKLILLLVIRSWKCNNESKKKITSLQTLVIWVCQLTLNIFPQWISKPHIQKHKNHSKASNGARRFAHTLRSQYNVWNCRSGRHNQRHTFGRHNTQYKPSLTNIPYYGLKLLKGEKTERLKLHLLVNVIGCFVLLIFVKI